MTQPFKAIYLSWRRGRSSRRHIIGKVTCADSPPQFMYLVDGVSSARAEGFTSYTEFPAIDKVYQDEGIQDILFQRLTPASRSSTSVTFDFWGVPVDQRDDRWSVLAYTQGLLPTDTYEFLADFEPTKGLTFTTDLAGLSHYPIPLDLVAKGDLLQWEIEVNNPKDPDAVLVSKNGEKVGYIKRIHANIFQQYNQGFIQLTVRAIEKNGIVKNVFVAVELL